ncbi:NADPH-dependent FMN reductase [Phenylobacterium sp. Root700]|uniref:NADPH-dependent FMN reductase n=1 Tax=Phenylobacterium sp. Root700 TaxID=1736591 RepID=UPI0009E88423
MSTGQQISVRIVAVAGSLRHGSTNAALLDLAARLAPSSVNVQIYEGLAALPHFNPDLDQDPLPDVVAVWRRIVSDADALLISSPEYASGIPGGLKNALDWLVGDPLFSGTPVALFNASPRATAAQESLKLVLNTMSAHLVADACITLPIVGPVSDRPIRADDSPLALRILNALRALETAGLQRRSTQEHPPRSGK